MEHRLLRRLADRHGGAGLHARPTGDGLRERLGRVRLRCADRCLSRGRLCVAGSGLADHQDRRRTAAARGALGARQPVADRTRHRRGVGGHANALGAHLRQVVRAALSGDADAGAAGHRRAVLRRRPQPAPAADAAGRRQRIRGVGAVRRHHRHLPAGVLWFGLQPLSYLVVDRITIWQLPPLPNR